MYIIYDDLSLILDGMIFCVQSVADKSSDGLLQFRWQWYSHGRISRPRKTWLITIITITRSAWIMNNANLHWDVCFMSLALCCCHLVNNGKLLLSCWYSTTGVKSWGTVRDGPKGVSDCHQGLIDLSLGHAPLLQKISSDSVHNFLSNLEGGQTQTPVKT